jgi:hypothetical protein
MTPPSSKRAAIATTVAALAAIVGGLFVIGTPSHARRGRLDNLRIADLTRISNKVDAYWKKHEALPAGLDTLRSDGLLHRIPKDPATSSAYTYHQSGERSYRLCATFAQPTDTANQETYVDGENVSAHSWTHGAGESCFDLTAPEKEKK